jgi:PPOX class probable F420-dependent enzyme
MMRTRARLANAASKATIHFYEAIRSPRAYDAISTEGVAGFTALAGKQYALLVTFRTSGEPVPTPVWFGLADEKLYFRSVATAAKLRRIATHPNVLVAPCTANGRPIGPAAPGAARILEPDEYSTAERAIRGNYGLSRRIYMRTIAGDVAGTYVEVCAGASHP